MAHKLTGKALEYVALNVEEIKKAPLDKRGMYVKVSDPSTGEQVMQRLKQAYAAKDYYKGLGWRDFTITFATVWQRDEAVNDANAALIEYFDTHEEPAPEPDPDTPNPTAPKDEEETKTDYTTYLIIGAAAVVIIALLLWQRK